MSGVAGRSGGLRPGSGRPPNALIREVGRITAKGAYYVGKALADPTKTDWDKAEKFGLPLALKAIPNLNVNENTDLVIQLSNELIARYLNLKERNLLIKSDNKNDETVAEEK